MPRRGEARARGSKGAVGSEHARATACGGGTADKQVYPSQGRPHLIIINVFADQLKGQKDWWAGRGRREDWSHSRSTPRTISPLACRLPLSALSNPTCRLQGHTPPPIPLPRQPAGGRETQCHRNRKLGPGPAGRPALPRCQIEFVVRAVEETKLGISIRP